MEAEVIIEQGITDRERSGNRSRSKVWQLTVERCGQGAHRRSGSGRVPKGQTQPPHERMEQASRDPDLRYAELTAEIAGFQGLADEYAPAAAGSARMNWGSGRNAT